MTGLYLLIAVAKSNVHSICKSIDLGKLVFLLVDSSLHVRSLSAELFSTLTFDSVEKCCELAEANGIAPLLAILSEDWNSHEILSQHVIKQHADAAVYASRTLSN